MLEGMDYCVRYVALPLRVHGLTVVDENGFYNIYINSEQSTAVQIDALRHELEHIKQNDFAKTNTPIEFIEAI